MSPDQDNTLLEMAVADTHTHRFRAMYYSLLWETPNIGTPCVIEMDFSKIEARAWAVINDAFVNGTKAEELGMALNRETGRLTFPKSQPPVFTLQPYPKVKGSLSARPQKHYEHMNKKKKGGKW